MNQLVLEQVRVFFLTPRKRDNNGQSSATVTQKETTNNGCRAPAFSLLYYACTINTMVLMGRKKVCKERHAAN